MNIDVENPWFSLGKWPTDGEFSTSMSKFTAGCFFGQLQIYKLFIETRILNPSKRVRWGWHQLFIEGSAESPCQLIHLVTRVKSRKKNTKVFSVGICQTWTLVTLGARKRVIVITYQQALVLPLKVKDSSTHVSQPAVGTVKRIQQRVNSIPKKFTPEKANGVQ